MVAAIKGKMSVRVLFCIGTCFGEDIDIFSLRGPPESHSVTVLRALAA